MKKFIMTALVLGYISFTTNHWLWAEMENRDLREQIDIMQTAQN